MRNRGLIPFGKQRQFPGTDADVLISVGGNPVQTDTDLTRILGELQPGTVLPVVCERRGVRIARDVVVGAMQAK